MALNKILVLFKTHLDIGFTDFSESVVKRYMEEFVPNAVRTARALRDKNTDAKFIWTTGSWLIYEYLRTHAGEDDEVIKAIKKGDISWHGLPFTTHTEIMSSSLFEKGLSLSRELDKRFGKKTVAAKMTDVPGHTKAIIPMLKKAGIEFLHLGVNPASAVPDVPEIFRWQAENGDEITVMYNKIYGSYAELGDTGTALYFAHTNDNLGGQSPEEVEALFAELHEKFPGAEIVAADLNDVAVALREIRDTLPVITSEIGDSWIYGTGSDPKKVSQYRELLRFGETLPESDDKDKLLKALLMIPEHTWGMDEKNHLDDNLHYSKEEFYPLRNNDNFLKMERSWQEQRAYITKAIDALSGGNREAAALLSDSWHRDEISTEGMRGLKPGEEFSLGCFTLSVNETGEIDSLRAGDKIIGDKDHRLGKLIYEQFCTEDFERFYKQYTRDDYWWAVLDFKKLGMETGVDRHYVFTPRAQACCDGERLVLNYSFDKVATERFGCPEKLQLLVCPDGDRLSFDLAWWNKPANRMGEAMWFGFDIPGDSKLVRKLGAWIDPTDVVHKGGRRLHATDFGVKIGDVTIETLDAHLVSPQEPSLLNFTEEEPKDHGVYFNLHNNLWGTNFPMWYEDDGRFRFILSI